MKVSPNTPIPYPTVVLAPTKRPQPTQPLPTVLPDDDAAWSTAPSIANEAEAAVDAASMAGWVLADASGAGSPLAAPGDTVLGGVGLEGTGNVKPPVVGEPPPTAAAGGLALGGLSLAAVGLSGTGSGAAGLGSGTGSLAVSGVVAMGPGGAGLVVQALAGDGHTVVARTTTDAKGEYRLSIPASYAGQVVTLKVLDDQPADGQGYLDEVTGEHKDLSIPLRAMVVVDNATTQTAVVSHATEIAAQIAASLRASAPEQIRQINQAVGRFLGVDDIVGTPPQFVGGDTPNPYGRALALLSGLDAVNARSEDNPTLATVLQIASALTVDGEVSATVNDVATLDRLSQAVSEVAQAQGRALADALTSVVQSAISPSTGVPLFITSSSNWVGSGKTVEVQLRFREHPTDADVQALQDALQVDGGTLSALQASADNDRLYTATLTQAGAAAPRVRVQSEDFFVNTLQLTLDVQAPVLAVSQIQGFDGTASHTQSPVHAGDVIRVTLEASERVQVRGTPTLLLDIGGASVPANYLPTASGQRHLVFEATVPAGVNDADGVSLRPNSFGLDGGSVQDAAGNDALPPVLDFSGPSVPVSNATPPTVRFVDVPTASVIVPGEPLRFTVVMDQPVTVSGSPRLLVRLMGSDRQLHTLYADFQPDPTTGNEGQTHLLFQFAYSPALLAAGAALAGGHGWQYGLGGSIDLQGGTLTHGALAANTTLHHVGLTAGTWLYASEPDHAAGGTDANDVLGPWEDNPADAITAAHTLTSDSASGGGGDRDVLAIPVLISDTAMTATQANGYSLFYDVSTDRSGGVTARTVQLHDAEGRAVSGMTFEVPLERANWPTGVEGLLYHLVFKDAAQGGAIQPASGSLVPSLALWKSVSTWRDATADANPDVFIQGSYRSDALNVGSDTTPQQRVQIMGGQGNDTLTGHDGPDILWGQGGNDRIDAGNGDDVVGVDAGANTLDGGQGNDTLVLPLHGQAARPLLSADGLLHWQSAMGTWNGFDFEPDDTGFTDDWVMDIHNTTGAVGLTQGQDGSVSRAVGFEALRLICQDGQQQSAWALHTGTAGADGVRGSTVGQGVIACLSGDDTVTLDGDAPCTVLAGPGNDTIVVNAAALQSLAGVPLIDGGAGLDTLRLGADAREQTVPAPAQPSESWLRGVDVIDLTGDAAGRGNALELNKAWMTQVVDASVDGRQTLTVEGIDGDELHFDRTDGWQLATTDRDGYALFTADVNQTQLRVYAALAMVEAQGVFGVS